MSESDPDYFSKEAVLARLRAGKMGSDRNKTLIWVLDGLALLSFFLLPFWLWAIVFVGARFVRGAPTVLGWINLALLPFWLVATFFWQFPLSPF